MKSLGSRVLLGVASLLWAATAAWSQQVITHSATQNIVAGNSISCNAQGIHADNSYWRSFNICSPFNISSQIDITSIEFGIENATAAAGSLTQPLTVRIYDDPNGGSPAPIASLVQLYEETIQLPNQFAGVFNLPLATPVSIGCNGTVVLEIHLPNGQAIGHSFFMGSNGDGQTGPSYLSSLACGSPEPTNLASIGFGDMHLVMNLVFDVGAPCAPCSGAPNDCHDPLFGSYFLRALDSTSFGDTPNSPIVDGVTSVATLSVAGAPGPIEDLDLYVRATHGYVGDVEFTLQSPSGINVVIHDNVGVNLQNFDCIFDDAGRINARPFDDGSRIMPSGPGMLADFIGADPNGTWTLTFTDGPISPLAGTLHEWELRFNRPVAIPDSNPTGVTSVLDVPADNVDDIQDLDVRVDLFHDNHSQLSVSLESPSGTTVTLLANNVAGAGTLLERFDDDAALQGFCDGFGSLNPTAGTLSAFDGEAVAGPWTLRVIDSVGGSLGVLNSFDLLINPVPCDPPTNLSCVSDCNAGDINLTWDIPAPFSAIEVRRDGVAIATLPGTATSYSDVAVAAGTYRYDIVGDCDPGRDRAGCTVTHAPYSGQTDIVFALEAADQIDSVAAVEAQLTGAGVSFLTTTSLDFACVDPATVQRVWVLAGTWPQNYQLTVTDGQALTQWHLAGVAIYLEGGDLWAIDPQTGFQFYDGVENQDLGNLVDGDDSVLEVFGANSGFGLDLTGISAPYDQASAGDDRTDRLVPAFVNPDIGGDRAGAILTTFDSGGFAYNVATYYDSTFAPVICSSVEFGGYTGNQQDLFGEYLSALAGVVPGVTFRRGDANGDGAVNLVDAIALLNYLFVPNSTIPACQDAADINDDNDLNLIDGISILNYLFVPASAPPPAPGPNACGVDPTPSALPSCVYDPATC